MDPWRESPSAAKQTLQDATRSLLVPQQENDNDGHISHISVSKVKCKQTTANVM